MFTVQFRDQSSYALYISKQCRSYCVVRLEHVIKSELNYRRIIDEY